MPNPSRRDQLFRVRLDLFTRTLHGVEQGDVRAVHQMRVATRRLRELMPILELEQEAGSRLSRRLRKVTRQLGPVRELDVLAQLVDELRESGRYSTADLDLMATAIAEPRAKAHEQLSAKQPTAERSRLGTRLERVAPQLEEIPVNARLARRAGRGWRWALEARLAHRASALGAAIWEAGPVYLPERLHAVRIAVKKLRYALELATDAAGVKPGADLRRLKGAQDLLGRMHDLQVLTTRARDAQASLAPSDLEASRALDAVVALLEIDCRQLHARYVRERSAVGAIAERLAGRSRVAVPRRTAAG